MRKIESPWLVAEESKANITPAFLKELYMLLDKHKVRPNVLKLRRSKDKCLTTSSAYSVEGVIFMCIPFAADDVYKIDNKYYSGRLTQEHIDELTKST